MENMQARAMVAAERYLTIRGFNVIESIGDDAIIAKDNGELVVAQVGWSENKFDAELWSVDKFEEVIHKFFLEHIDDDDLVEIPIRYDVIILSIIKHDRAIVRHHINAQTRD